jgi:hypothetical protein
MTVEDPVEYQLPGIQQVQVSPSIGLTFARALRSFLRHNPNIVMVGKIRDLERRAVGVSSLANWIFVGSPSPSPSFRSEIRSLSPSADQGERRHTSNNTRARRQLF